ncbi:NTE family protein [Variovorax boronicumulans]|uniref:NTE family protein n=2 Tax=Variovorax boronicumulans TaxID=436515 RepID=A0AAW8CUJ4_9BURK|nr:patatin-like phospholipase family protein [Variovorax boronicumulans]MDP9891423.1 NTE family protein [Variovorax boronicumulans]MDQ0051491.1 NTE family protein [Variovorax boronicumulans]
MTTTPQKKARAASTQPLNPFASRREDMRQARKALVLQGGGALGAYQAGVYAALSETELQPHWIAGVSIGAINAALIAGNAPEHRVDRLREFWHLVSSGPSQRLPSWFGDRATQNQYSAAMASLVGIPGFFEPRYSPALLMGGAAPLLSYYDTSPLKATLERLIDFDRINACEARFSVGAVNVRTGNSVYFDNTRQRIGPEHIMASGALPPGFAPVHIDGDDYWDGGIVSNTPLQYVLDIHPRNEPLVVLQVDLFNARGEMPHNMAGVMERQKDITYSSRTRMNTDATAANMNLQQAIADLITKLPANLRKDPSVLAVQSQLTHEPIDIFHLIYRDKPYELESKDYEFSRAAVEEHWESGARDMRTTLAHPETLRADATVNGVTTFDLGEHGAGRVKRPGLSR